MIPQKQWANLAGNAQPAAPIQPRQPLGKNLSRPPDAEHRLQTFIQLCRERDLLTPQGEKDLITLDRTNRLYDGAPGEDALHYLKKMVTEPRQVGVDLKQLINQTLRHLAAPADSIHQ